MQSLLRMTLFAAAVAVFLYSLLAISERYFPQFFPTKVDFWLLGLLFGVMFVKGFVGWLITVIPKRKRRKT
jgi:uncharacterized BrkB/YihY/UPF0761 family membrane protein